MSVVEVNDGVVDVVVSEVISEVIVSEDVVSVVEVGTQGPPGARGLQGETGLQGPQGEPGVGVQDTYVHVQASVSDTWVITHGLGSDILHVQVLNSAGTEVIGSVTYDSVNQVTIVFSSAFSGRARLTR